MTEEPQDEDGDMAGEASGLLIIRAWLEPGSTEPLRAQVRLSTDVSAGIERTMTFSQPREVGAAVQHWLVDMLTCPEG